MSDTGPTPHDGEADFSSYSEAQLRDLRHQLDATRFPRNNDRLLAELDHRKSARMAGPRQPVRYTNADGFIGWIQAKLGRQSLYGDGSVEIREGQLALQGWQRTWLGTAQRTELQIPLSDLRNAFSDSAWVEFESKHKWRLRKRFTFQARDADAAAAIAAQLPPTRTKWFENKASEIQSFYRLQRSPGHRSWLTPLIVFINFAVYVALVIKLNILGGFDGTTLTLWGGNYAPDVVNGEWWRLFTAIFLHLNLLHIAANMWVLWSVGRFTERLYGNWPYLAIYCAAGLAGGLASVAWNPAGLTVGASGAIFGVLGALIAFLIHGRTRVPVSIMRAHLLPTCLFTLYSIGSGMLQPGIDNAAHVGGLVTGLALGWALAPLSQSSERRLLLLLQSTVAMLLVAGMAAALISWVQRYEVSRTPAEIFAQNHPWYVSGEAADLRLWQALAVQAANGTISNADLADQFENRIAPFWRSADLRIHAEASKTPTEQGAFIRTLSEFAHSRHQWADALIQSLKSTDPTRSEVALKLMDQTDLVQARLDRLTTRYSFEKAAGSLAQSAPIIAFENFAWFKHLPCVHYPFPDTNPVVSSDSETDAPKQSEKLACFAQYLFLTRDFADLDRMLNEAAAHLGDLPDGSSSLDSLVGGLDDLFSFGRLSIQDQLNRTAAWRKAVPGSVEADPIEAMIFEDWAYAARGFGYANTISQQNTSLYIHRARMADAELMALWKHGPDNPIWYQQAIHVGVDLSAETPKLRQIFDRGRNKFPKDWAMYRAMMRALMPRWGGSYQAEAKFMLEQGQKEGDAQRGWQTIGRLLWMYSIMEQDQVDVLTATRIPWEGVDFGLALLTKRYPKSDYISNILGKFACVAGDRIEYLAFHSNLPRHYSASVWSQRISIQSCNKKFGLV